MAEARDFDFVPTLLMAWEVAPYPVIILRFVSQFKNLPHAPVNVTQFRVASRFKMGVAKARVRARSELLRATTASHDAKLLVAATAYECIP